MDDLSKKQYKLLKKLYKKNLIQSELSEKDNQRIESLGKIGLVKYKNIFEDENSLKVLDNELSITPKGEAAYDSYVRSKRRWLIPVIISIAALIISIIALYKTSQPVKIYLNDEIIRDNSVITNAIPDI